MSHRLIEASGSFGVFQDIKSELPNCGFCNCVAICRLTAVAGRSLSVVKSTDLTKTFRYSQSDGLTDHFY
jgi:hypothetical protein